jgi:hypothetical protein
LIGISDLVNGGPPGHTVRLPATKVLFGIKEDTNKISVTIRIPSIIGFLTLPDTIDNNTIIIHNRLRIDPSILG